MTYGASPILAALVAALTAIIPPATARAADKARVTDFTDVDFGLVAGLGDHSISQNLCAYTTSNLEAYSVTARGDGPGGSFALSSGAFELGYDVLWADAANTSNGTALAPGVPSSGFISTVKQHSCNSGAPASASLTIVLRNSVLRNARAGSYAGVLQVTITPE